MKVSLLIFWCCFFSACVFGQDRTDTIPLLPDHYLARVALFKKEAVANDRVVFLGDGFIEMGNWKKLLKDSSVVNRGISGDISSSLLLRLREIASRRPAKVYLMIGEGDLFKRLPNETIIENVFSIVTTITRSSKTTKIFVLGILPVDPSHKKFPAGHDKQDQASVINAQLAKYAARLNYTFVDMNAAFTDAKGHLDVAYTSNGVALNAAGYVHWIDVLKKKNCL